MRFEFQEVQQVTIYEKLAEVHAAIQQPVKDSLNPHFNSTFASLNECNRVVSNAVREVGECDFWQRAVYSEEARSWVMETVFTAAGQELVLSRHPFQADANPQKTASASTYARRYSMVSAFNLAAEDDDGNQASRPPDTASGIEASKRRMWAAVQAFAASVGANPKDIIAELQSPGAQVPWQDNADYFEMVAMKYEGMLDG